MGSDSMNGSASGVPPPHPELLRLSPLIGSWVAEDRTSASVLGPGVPVRSVERFSWLDGGYFLVSTYETRFGDEPIQTGVMYWGYDAAAGRFHNRFFSNNGPYTPQGNEYVGEVLGDELVFIGPARFAYELGADGRIRVGDDGSIRVQWWLRDASSAWQPWMTNTFIRTGS